MRCQKSDSGMDKAIDSEVCVHELVSVVISVVFLAGVWMCIGTR